MKVDETNQKQIVNSPRRSLARLKT